MKKNEFSIYDIIIYACLFIIIAVILFPLLNVLAVSLSSNIHVNANDITIFPRGFNLDTYKMVFRESQIYTAYKNTLIYVIIGTFLSLSVTSMAGYALSKKKLIFRKKFMIFILITMFFNGGMIPLFLTIKNLGIYNTMWAIILTPLVNAWYLIIMRSFFEAFPEEIGESGQLDGLNDIGILWYLVLPVSKAVLATIGLFYAVNMWNSYYYPFIFLDSTDKYPLQLVLRAMLYTGEGLGSSKADQPVITESLKYATIIVSVVPIILVYPFLQKYFVKGVMVGSIKG